MGRESQPLCKSSDNLESQRQKVVLASLRQELEKISWPIPELKRLVLDDEIPSYWNEYAYMEQVLKWIDGLKLPQFYQKEDLNMYLGRIKRSSTDFTLAV